MQTLNSKAVAEMLGKRHDNFKRELRKYVATLGEAAGEYFLEGTYKDAMGRERSGYLITLKGCELIAGRMIGVKSDEFREKYKPLFSVEEKPSTSILPYLKAKNEAEEGYSTDEVADKLGCSRRTVQRMIQRGDLATTQVTIMVPTKKTVVMPEELARYQKERAFV